MYTTSKPARCHAAPANRGKRPATLIVRVGRGSVPAARVRSRVRAPGRSQVIDREVVERVQRVRLDGGARWCGQRCTPVPRGRWNPTARHGDGPRPACLRQVRPGAPRAPGAAVVGQPRGCALRPPCSGSIRSPCRSATPFVPARGRGTAPRIRFPRSPVPAPAGQDAKGTCHWPRNMQSLVVIWTSPHFLSGPPRRGLSPHGPARRCRIPQGMAALPSATQGIFQ